MFASYAMPKLIPYYPKQFCADVLIRYAIGGNDKEEFEQLTDNFFFYGDPDITQIIFVAIILYKKGKYELLDIFIDTLNRSYIDNLTNETADLLMLKSCMDIVDHFLFGTEFTSRPGRQYTDYLVYFAMITGKKRTFKRYIKSGKASTTAHHFYLMSAVAFQDTEMLKIMLDNGMELVPSMAELAFFCTSDALAKFVCENLFMYVYKFEHEGNDADNLDAVSLIEHSVYSNNMITFAKALYETVSEERFREIFSSLPKISAISENEIPDIMYFYENDIDIHEYFDETVEVTIGNAKYLSYFYRELPGLTGVNFSYNFYFVEEPCFKGWDDNKVIDLLANKDVSFQREYLTPIIKELLDRNSEKLTGHIISSKLINRVNIGEVIDYLAENKLYNALNKVNQSEIPDIRVYFDEWETEEE